MKMRSWTIAHITDSSWYTLVPDARARLIRHQYQSDDDQRRQAAVYCINVSVWANWELLAMSLYVLGEKESTEVFKAQLPKPKGNQCDCVECVGAVCSDSVHSAL